MNRKSRVRVAVLVCAALAFCLPAAAAADNDDALFVSHSAMSTGSGTSCATAKYSTVQSAVDAAHPGQTVYLCGTTPYAESVLVQKNLKLTGDSGAAIQAPLNSRVPTTFFSSQNLQTPNAVLTLIGKINVQVNGLTIEGPFQNTSCGFPTGHHQTDDDYDVLVIGGAAIQMNSDQVLMAGPSNPAQEGCQFGVGIQVGRRYWPVVTGTGNDGANPPDFYNIVNFVGRAEIQNTTVKTYAKNGITVDGPGSTAHIHGSTVDGGTQDNTIVARNGIQISRGATGEVEHNAINNNEYTGPSGSASSTGVLVFGGCGDPLSTMVHVHDNTLHNNDTGVSISDFDPSCSTAPSTQTNNEVNNNTISKSDGETNMSPFTDENNNPYTGYQVGIAETGNNDNIHNNTITGTVVGTSDTAFGPQTAPGGAFLAPIDIQTFPPIKAKVHDNKYDGKPTNPPY